MNIAASIEDLSFTYREADRPALRKIDGQIGESSFVVVMGHGGAGKSTLCFALNGLVPQFFKGRYEGRVTVKGREVSRHKVADLSRVVGLVLQDFEAQLFSTNVELEMAFGPENHCLPRPEIERRIERYLAFVGLERLRQREPSTLSGGQKQRLAIGSVLATEPNLLVMDEPTTDLDPAGREEVLSIAYSLKEEARTLLVVDHEPEVATRADVVWLMKDGQIIAQGPPHRVLTDLQTLSSCGIKAPPIVDLFRRMNWPGEPLTSEEAVTLIKDQNLARPRKLRTQERCTHGTSGPWVLQAERLEYLYPGHSTRALKGIDLTVQEGECIAILGQNGSGKTTLAKHFNGLLKPTSGRMWVEGRPTTGYLRRELARRIGYVFQNPDHQIFCRTVREEVGFGLKVSGEDPRTIEKRVLEALEAVGLLGYEEKIPFALTKGERQRVAVASVLATQPRVLILDEPTTGLDYGHQLNMMEMLKNLNQQGHTVIIITHSMWVAAEYAKRTIVMKDGSILLDGPTRAVFAREDLLREASLRPPVLLELSNCLGTQALTVEEMVKELRTDQ